MRPNEERLSQRSNRLLRRPAGAAALRGSRPGMMRNAPWVLAVLLWVAGGVEAKTPSPAARRSGEGRLLDIRLEGPVSPVMDEALGQALDRAEHQGYRALVIEIDTPGGLESS